ncbi:LOW QUALITY PROTEIN: auxin-responsive protein IAA26-like [Prosopis cineraria]|uniref:LOW QUALITY PROTEIN: auxin-responsive protein IAA26-like n=1 Tax=Prosopis cineraria TaxID=364024 RepID=UPI00240FF12E|nr:LOW QUALITY PROTEIN: auxin-responsive protein IAA26-like [Prosopis cineraria]
MYVRSRNEEQSPQLLDLIPKEEARTQNSSSNKSCEERKLELTLGPPGEDWSLNHNTNVTSSDESLLSLGLFSQQTQKISASSWAPSKGSSFLQFPSCSPQGLPGLNLQNSEKKAFSSSCSSANPAVPSNTSQKRTAPGPVVGWPPIRSFRKKLASNSCSKTASETQQQQDVADKVAGKKPVVDNVGKGLFVKINMDGVPIGRKVDLNAYDSYENLSSAVDELFRCLLAAQRDSTAGGIQNKEEEEKAITGLLDGSGEYTLVYEDNEGDRMLVGDVPWHMFVSTVKRLRVLKSSELSAFTLGNKQAKKTN